VGVDGQSSDCLRLIISCCANVIPVAGQSGVAELSHVALARLGSSGTVGEIKTYLKIPVC
jgi:hypothetical protein